MIPIGGKRSQSPAKPHEKSHTAGALALHIANVPGSVVRSALLDESPLPDFATLFKQPATVQEIHLLLVHSLCIALDSALPNHGGLLGARHA